MNRAQKRTWLSLVISLAGISLGAAVIATTRAMHLDMANADHRTTIRLLSLALMIPLILIVIIQWGWKKVYDERDIQIDNKAIIIGSIGTFVFLGAAAWFLCIITKMGSIKVAQITLLVYLAVFVWIFISSITALIQYGWRSKGEKL